MKNIFRKSVAVLTLLALMLGILITPGNEIKAAKITINLVRDGLNYAAVFDPVYYAKKYPDVKRAYGNDQQKAFDHFLLCGMKEGRQGKESFNVFAYINRYKDLRDLYGCNLTEYYRHYMTYGWLQGRNTKPFKGNDPRNKRINYVLISRVYNGLDYSAVFNPIHYIDTYYDVRTAYNFDQQKAFDHFLLCGMKEGRQGNSSFNVYTYINQHTVLLDIYGTDLPAIYRHYITDGKKNGIKASGKDRNISVKNYVRAVKEGEAVYKISILNPYSKDGTVTDVYMPTWSTANGTDDINWYHAVKDESNTWSVKVNGWTHNSSGEYNTIIYGVVNGKNVQLGIITYDNSFDLQLHYGWHKLGDNYYYFDRANGSLQKGTSVNGISLNNDGSAVMTDYAKQKIPVMIRAREIVEEITSPADSFAVKQRKCYNYVAAMPYLLKMYPVKNFKDNYACLDAVYANNLLNAYGDQNKCGGECVAEAAALGYLYLELGMNEIYLCSDTAHGWIRAGGRYFDPLFTEAKGESYYDAATYPLGTILQWRID